MHGGVPARLVEDVPTDNLLASQDVFIRSYIHLMSTTQLDRSRSPTMPCILLVYILYRKIAEKSLPAVQLGWLAPARQ